VFAPRGRKKKGEPNFFYVFANQLIDNFFHRICELWCGETDGAINVFQLHDSVISGQHSLQHFKSSIPLKGLTVTLLYAFDENVYSYVSPGCILYQWNTNTLEVENRLDCSKLVPCSESLKSIAIEEHLSPGKCQVTALAGLNDEIYIGTTWGCVIIAEKATLSPVSVFRPFIDEVRAMIPLWPQFEQTTPLMVIIGRGYRSLIDRYTESTTTGTISTPTTSNGTDNKKAKEALMKDRNGHMHAIIWRAEHWNPV
jgi:hypothetical protein